MKTEKARLVLLQIRELQAGTDEDNIIGLLVMVNEIIRNTTELVEEVLADEDKAA